MTIRVIILGVQFLELLWYANFMHGITIVIENTILVCSDIKFIRQDQGRGYKTFFMLNSDEHEILNAHKYKNIKKFSFFSDSDKPRMLFFLLLNVKMPTIVGIFTFMCRKNFMLS